ncbi:hypothetical protein FOCG_07578 [Fusarium oxysporum f. sp. radicis-lycopersici 26381]|nr:hypothetical protein FOCG_07578 [Fusarium oxysporum f. sp. radicis-lycopersici 26381]
MKVPNVHKHSRYQKLNASDSGYGCAPSELKDYLHFIPFANLDLSRAIKV